MDFLSSPIKRMAWKRIYSCRLVWPRGSIKVIDFGTKDAAIYVSAVPWRTPSGYSVLGDSYVHLQTDARPQEMFVSIRTFGVLSARHVLRVFGSSWMKYWMKHRVCTVEGRCSWSRWLKEKRNIVYIFSNIFKSYFEVIGVLKDSYNS